MALLSVTNEQLYLALGGQMFIGAVVVGLLIAAGFVLVRFGVVLGAPWYARLSAELEPTLRRVWLKVSNVRNRRPVRQGRR